MARIQTYKFVNPGVAANPTPVVSAATKNTLAINRLGSTVSSITVMVGDLEKIAIAQIKNDKLRQQAERRAERRRLDARAEQSVETGSVSSAAKGRAIKSKLGTAGKKSLGFIENFLGPIGNFLLKLGTFFAVKELLEFTGDEENQEKLKTFFERAKFVFDKIFGWAKTLTQTTLDGLGELTGENSTFVDRLKGLGKIMLGIAGLRYLMNPFAIISDIYNLLGGAEDVLPDDVDGRKPKKKPGKPPKPRGYYDDAVEASQEAAERIRKSKPNAVQRFFNFLGDQGKRGVNFLGEQGGRALSSLKNLPGWATEQYSRLSAAAKASWEKTVKASQAIANKGKAFASSAGNKFKAAGDWVADGGQRFFNKMTTGARNFFIEKVLTPLRPIIDPIAKKASQIGQAMFDMLMKIPGAEKIIDVLKKKGIGSMGDIATAGGKLGKRAAAVLPVIGGLVNLAFAYDRAANGDSIGALIEGTSGILDIAGLATGGAGSVASMLLDGYMFARDFIPQLQQGEEAVVDAVGARGLKNNIDNVLSKLPNIGEIINMITGKQNDNTPAPDGEGQTLSDGGSVVEPKPYFLGGIVKGISKAVSGIGRGISKVVSGVGNAIGGVINSPIGQIVTTAAGALIPGAAPIIAGVRGAVGMMQGDPMGAVMAGLNMIPGVSGFIGGVTDTVNKFMSGPVGQIASSLFSGDIAGAAVTGLGLINPEIGQLAGSILSGGFNPMNMIGNIAEQFNMTGLYKAVTGVMGGNYTDAIAELGGQLGIDPKILGAIDRATTKALSKDGISAEYALQEAMEFVPVPVILEKLLPMPTPVPINTPGQTIVTGVPSRLSERS